MQTQPKQLMLFDPDEQPNTSSDYGIIHYRIRNGVPQQRVGFGHWTRKTKETPQVEIKLPTHKINISDPSAPYTPTQMGIKPQSLPKSRGGSNY